MRTPVLLLSVAACSGGAEVRPSPVPAPMTLPAAPMTLAQAGIVPEWLDRRADPCQDFFAYACGGFVASAVIPPDRSSWSAVQIVVKQNEELLRDVLEKAAAVPGGDPVTQK